MVTIEDTYKKVSQHEHVLLKPGMYIGSIESDTQSMSIYDNETNKIIQKDITYVPGLYKIFDEILVNSRDHSIRDPTCTKIKCTINKDTGFITVYNNGKGIPVELHKEYKIYIPELIFGNLLTSSNYDKNDKKTVGGMNGLGAKCANIYSTTFIVETYDKNKKKLYYQEFSNNMFKINKPVIKEFTSSEDKKMDSFTKISFKPDFEKFNLKNLTNDIIFLFKKRVYDISATTNSKVEVFFNDILIKTKDFKDYIKLYYDKLPSKIIYNEQQRWKVGVLYDSNSGYTHMSFVNGICTYQGGTHIDHILNQITDSIIKYIKEKKKINVKAQYIKENISIYLDSVIENPAFNSQTKECLTTKSANFGSHWKITPEFLKELINTGLVEEVIKYAELKQSTELNKSDGRKITNLMGIDKLEDAKWAGTSKSKYCKLILTEGDSAKAYAMAGRDIVGNERFGIFPLRGKFINVREATIKQIQTNKEFINIKKILGLKQNMKYTDVSKLRYGGITILTDQDLDGSHIKGLIMNMFHTFWPSLLKIDGFIQTIATPIVKATKKSDVKKKNPCIFNTIADYKNWFNSLIPEERNNWIIKYYKGLGTSTENEAKEVFREFDSKKVDYIWEVFSEDNKNENENENENEDDNKSNKSSDSNKNNTNEKDNEENETEEENIDEDNTEDNTEDNAEEDDNDDDDLTENDYKSKSHDALTLAFEKKRANDRKNWLFKYNPNNTIDTNDRKITYSEFVNKDLIHFSNYDNERSIPKLADGLKPSQRKILYAAILKNIFATEIKVAQFAAYVSENTQYHHGEASLQSTIVKMAQNFVNSNNINLLIPSGNFGHRKQNGEEAADARYIFTQLNKLVKCIFRVEDKDILNYIDEEGTLIEPSEYAPIIPLILINGSEGIGTGFSTKIPMFNPKDVINNILKMLDGEQPDDIHPWYKGFKGKIVKTGDYSYNMYGVYEVINETTIRITEIPIKYSIDSYKYELENHVEEIFLKREKDKDKENKENKNSKSIPKRIKEDQYFIDNIQNNSGNNKIDFTIQFTKNYLQQFLKNNTLEKNLKLISSISLSNMYLHNTKGVITKYEYIEDIFHEFYSWRLGIYQQRKNYKIKFLENEMNILKYKIKFINQILKDEIKIYKRKESDILNDLVKLKYPMFSSDISETAELSYSYLTSMKLFSLTEEKINELENNYKNKKKEYDDYKSITIQDLWKNDLIEFKDSYEKWYIDSIDETDENNLKNNKKKKEKENKNKNNDNDNSKKIKTVKIKKIKID